MPRLSSIMLSIEKVVVEECAKSQYVRPFRLSYVQNGKQKKWDLIKSHDSVAIVIHHIERDSLLFVRQFRPAVYFNRIYAVEDGEPLPSPGTAIEGDLNLGMATELCAGIVDKSKSLAEIAVEEIYEECGYKVAVESLEKISSFRTGIGVTGSNQTMFYAQVTEGMRDESAGGGNPSEGEMIETVEVPISQVKDFIFDENLAKPHGCAFGVIWFLKEKCKPTYKDIINNHVFEIGVVSAGVSLLALSAAYGIYRLTL